MSANIADSLKRKVAPHISNMVMEQRDWWNRLVIVPHVALCRPSTHSSCSSLRSRVIVSGSVVGATHHDRKTTCPN